MHRFSLIPGEAHAYTPQTDTLISALAGTLWVTQSGDGRDILLQEGQQHTTSGRGKVVIQALDNAHYTVVSTVSQAQPSTWRSSQRRNRTENDQHSRTVVGLAR